MRSPPLPSGVDDALALLLSETEDARLVDALCIVRRALHARSEVERGLRQELAAAKRTAAEQSAMMRAELVDLRTALVTNLAMLRSDVARTDKLREEAAKEEALLPPPPPPPLPESDARVLRSPRGRPPGVAAPAVVAAAAAKEGMAPILASALMSRAAALEASISSARAAAEDPLQPSTATTSPMFGRRISLPTERRERQLRWRMEWEGLGLMAATKSNIGGALRARAAPSPKAEGSVPVSTASRLVSVSDDSSSEADSSEEEEEKEKEKEEGEKEGVDEAGVQTVRAQEQRTFSALAARASFPSARDAAAAAAIFAIEAATVEAAAALEGHPETTSDEEISGDESSTTILSTSSDGEFASSLASRGRAHVDSSSSASGECTHGYRCVALQ